MTVSIVLTLLVAHSGAKAETPVDCPSNADFNTADWLIDRAKATAIKDIEALHRCQTTHPTRGGRIAPACREAASAKEKSREAWKAAIDQLPMIMREQASEQCRAQIMVY